MRPIKFREQTRVLLKPSGMTDEECKSLPVYTDGNRCVSCWRLSFFERIRVLFSGTIWLIVHSGKTQPPVKMICGEKIFKEE